jgi:hypothetical protein
MLAGWGQRALLVSVGLGRLGVLSHRGARELRLGLPQAFAAARAIGWREDLVSLWAREEPVEQAGREAASLKLG